MVLEIKANCQIKEVKLLLKDEDLNSLPFTRESWLTENTHTLYQKAIMIPCRIIKKVSRYLLSYQEHCEKNQEYCLPLQIIGA